VATKAHIKGTVDSKTLNKMKRPKKTIADLTAQGFVPVDRFPADTAAFPIRLEAKYDDEYWLGLHNFYVIGRYNPRVKYAMAVFQLSQQIRHSMCSEPESCAS
jgi:membrane-bound lytic murein transglycosylase B